MTVQKGLPRVSVVVPTYNERENIREFKRRLEPVLESMGGRLTVLFVDDNSPDGTGDEIRSMMESTPGLPAPREGRQEGAGHCVHRRLPPGGRGSGTRDRRADGRRPPAPARDTRVSRHEGRLGGRRRRDRVSLRQRRELHGIELEEEDDKQRGELACRGRSSG